MSMWQAISSAMMRRKRWTILLILIALLETGAAMVLCMLAARQESALEKTIDNTVIPCVVTDAYGLNQDNLHMATGFVDLLCGLRHESGRICRKRAGKGQHQADQSERIHDGLPPDP